MYRMGDMRKNRTARSRKRTGLLTVLLLSGLLAAGPALAADFTAPVDHAVGDKPDDIVAADLNNDGALDLVTADHKSDQVSVLLGDGNGGFGPAVAYATAQHPVTLVASDLDRDGNLDLAVACHKDDQVSILFGDGTGGFSPAVHYGFVSKPRWLAVGDFNGDGHRDLIASEHETTDQLEVLLGQSGGTFVDGGSYGGGGGQSKGKAPAGLVVDLDGNGWDDVAMVSGVDDSIHVFLADGLGGFHPEVGYLAGTDPEDVLTRDLNGDGLPDLVVANRGDDSVTVHLGTGFGSLAPAIAYAAGISPMGVVAGDFDGDCIPDLAVTSKSEVVVLVGDGLGGFGAPDPAPLGEKPDAVAAADLDGDLQADLAVVDTKLNQMSVLLGDLPVGCTQFHVRRSTDPATLSSAPIYATIGSSPWEDVAGSLSDGQTYYYSVEHAAGLPLTISAHANGGADVVRLGTNDGDPLSAPVDAFLSDCSLSPSSVPADGLTTASVVVEPRDAFGVPLGSGLHLEVDENLLLPGGLAGPVQDRGDGTYSFGVVSSTVGGGLVVVTVEGIMLNESPTITYVAP